MQEKYLYTGICSSPSLGMLLRIILNFGLFLAAGQGDLIRVGTKVGIRLIFLIDHFLEIGVKITTCRTLWIFDNNHETSTLLFQM